MSEGTIPISVQTSPTLVGYLAEPSTVFAHCAAFSALPHPWYKRTIRCPASVNVVELPAGIFALRSTSA